MSQANFSEIPLNGPSRVSVFDKHGSHTITYSFVQFRPILKWQPPPSHHPQSNIMERFRQTLNQIARTYMMREDKSWHRYIDTFAFASDHQSRVVSNICASICK